MIRGVIVILCFALLLCTCKQAETPVQYFIEQQKLTSNDGSSSDYFGYSVSIGPNWAVVGAPYDDDNGNASGSAYIFHWNGSSWVDQFKVLASDGASGDNFGYSVSIGEDWAIIGSYWDDDKGSNSGSAYIYHWNGSNWVEHQKITASDGIANDRFGYSVGIKENKIIVGAYTADRNGSSCGAAYIFFWNGSNWLEQQMITASDGASGDSFGCSVGIDGDLAVAGAYLENEDGFQSGSAYVYKWNGLSWEQQKKLTATDGADTNFFGYSVAISGNRTIIGAYGHNYHGDDSGASYIFHWNDVDWVQEQRLLAKDGMTQDYFGYSVAIEGDRAIVGANWDDDTGGLSGSVYVYARNNSNWEQQQKLTALEGQPGDQFGCSVALFADRAIIGAYADIENAMDTGSVYIFRYMFP